MPVNKDALMRYRIIDRLLSDPNKDYTTNEILYYVNRECDPVSKRMIQKDIKSLEEEFGKELIRNAGRSGTVRYADQSSPLFYQELTWEESEMLREVLRSLGQFDGLDNFIWLDLLRKKLDMAEADCGHPLISFSKNEGLQLPENLLGRLYIAIARKKVIQVTYTPFNDEPRRFIVHPYQLKQFNDRWFLLCAIQGTPQYPFNPEFILNLALDRMEPEFDYVDDEPYFECIVDLKARYDEIVGVTLLQDSEIFDIYFAVDDESLDYVRTKWLHTTQIELDPESQEEFRSKYPSLKDKTFFSIECRENYELYARFASYMKNIVIVEPLAIREKMSDFLVEASEIYRTL